MMKDHDSEPQHGLVSSARVPVRVDVVTEQDECGKGSPLVLGDDRRDRQCQFRGRMAGIACDGRANLGLLDRCGDVHQHGEVDPQQSPGTLADDTQYE
jgi:hypothetical protein